MYFLYASANDLIPIADPPHNSFQSSGTGFNDVWLGGRSECSFPGCQTKAGMGCVFLFSPVLPGTAASLVDVDIYQWTSQVCDFVHYFASC